ncbi:hypothetical protein DB88DRAFT_498808 [Papiliotrema laurentii]|uniref:Uncharacterized protein n=1 Tax=Papiliotrema laurentii TaxID=5418 RepID=A0AAD9FN28_PAPLA|nr:hypothetical protein DB88DRAFT_498808 [Papiliotrema laurentii]
MISLPKAWTHSTRHSPSEPTLLWNISPNVQPGTSGPSHKFRVAYTGTPPESPAVDLDRLSSAMNWIIEDMNFAFPAMPPLTRAVSRQVEYAIPAALSEQGVSVPAREAFKPDAHSTEQTWKDWTHFQSRLPTEQAFSKSEQTNLPTQQPSMPDKGDGKDTVYINWSEPEATTTGEQDRSPTLRVVANPNVLTAKERKSLIEDVEDIVYRAWEAKSGISKLLMNGPAWREHKARQMTYHYLRGRGLTEATVETIREPSFFPWSHASQPDPTWTQFESACQNSGQHFSEKSLRAGAGVSQVLSAAFWDVADTTIPAIVNKHIPPLLDRLKSTFGRKESAVCENGSSV